MTGSVKGMTRPQRWLTVCLAIGAAGMLALALQAVLPGAGERAAGWRLVPAVLCLAAACGTIGLWAGFWRRTRRLAEPGGCRSHGAETVARRQAMASRQWLDAVLRPDGSGGLAGPPPEEYPDLYGDAGRPIGLVRREGPWELAIWRDDRWHHENDWQIFELAPGCSLSVVMETYGMRLAKGMVQNQLLAILQSMAAQWRNGPGSKGLSVTDGYLLEMLNAVNDFLHGYGRFGVSGCIKMYALDEVSGVLRCLHGGHRDQWLHRAGQPEVVNFALPSAPAIGMFSSTDSFPPFFRANVETVELAPGDTVIVTSEFNNNRRTLRDGTFRPASFPMDDAKKEALGAWNGTEAEDGTWLATEESFNERAQAIMEAVMNRGVYRLEKYANPIAGELLEFDFSGCSGRPEEMVLAVAAVERIFRLTPYSRSPDTVEIHEDLDAFLRGHFRAYGRYFARPLPLQQEDAPGIRRFAGLLEDEPFRDVLIHAIRRRP